jgi:gliding motility associated protien GldN
MRKWTFFFCLLFTNSLFSQPIDNLNTASQKQPIDGVVEKTLMEENQVLAYPQLEERDIFWERRIWQEIDTREKINLPFRYPEAPLFSILVDEIKKGNIVAYDPLDDQFTTPVSWNELAARVNETDTIEVYDPITYEVSYEVVQNQLNPEDIVKYRIKETWFVDSKHSVMKVRILGLAPIIEVRDEMGNYLYEKPMFWIYYPHARYALADYQVFNPWNTNSPLSWEDWLEMRFFDSFIVKESNVHDRRLKDYLTGVDVVLEAEKIREEIFNFEQDLWSY